MSQIQDESYDAVIDKALLDCLIAERLDRSGPIKMIQEIHRILKMGGIFITISSGTPETRRPLLEMEDLFVSLRSYLFTILHLYP